MYKKSKERKKKEVIRPANRKIWEEKTKVGCRVP